MVKKNRKMETRTIIISSLKDIPKSVIESLTTPEKNILLSLFRYHFKLECHISLSGYEIEPLYFRPVDLMQKEMFKGHQVPPERKASFDVALRHFIKFLLSYETTDNVVFLRDKRIGKGWPITLSQMEESFVSLSMQDYRILHITKDKAKELYYSGEKKKEAIMLNAINTTKLFYGETEK